jgi:hypothetical protein
MSRLALNRPGTVQSFLREDNASDTRRRRLLFFFYLPRLTDQSIQL